MSRSKSKMAGTIAIVSIVPMVGLASPASAVTCVAGTKYTSTASANSTQFDATADCNGLYAKTASSRSDDVRGRYQKDGWKVSSYGWVYITTSNDGYDKIIGNTVTGRNLKGQGRNYSQNVSYIY